MPWKMDETGNLMKGEDGNPIAITENGEERSVDYSAMSKKLSEVNRESAGRKERIRELEAQLKPLEGIEDVPSFIETARRNAESVAAFDDKQKGTEEAIRVRVDAAVSPLKKQIAELEAGKADVEKRLHNAMIDAQFSSSKYANENLISPAMAKALFAKNFSIDSDGKLVAVGDDGFKVGEDGTFDSMLKDLVTNSPFKTAIEKGSPATGSGANTGSGNSPTGQKTIRRSEFEKLDPATKSARLLRDRYVVIDG